MIALFVALSALVVTPELEEELVRLVPRASAAVVFIDGGSGVVISPDGLVLTCNHVVPGDRRDWPVYGLGGREFSGRVLGRQFESDLALLKLEGASDLAFLPLAPSGSARVGETVLTLGNPFLLGTENPRFLPVPPEFVPSVSVGVISGVHRFGRLYGDAIECDAPLNPGNSGGPLVNTRGEIVAIGGRIASRFGIKANSGAGYGASCDLIRRFLPALLRANGGEVYVGDLPGVFLRRDAAALVVEKVEAAPERGDADKDGAGDGAKLRPGDTILSVGSVPVRSTDKFLSAIGSYPAASTAVIWVRRDGKDVEIPVRLEARSIDVAFLGVRVRDHADGIEIQEVMDPARKAGLAAGDIILSIEGIVVGSPEELAMLLFTLRAGDEITVEVSRTGEKKEISVKLQKAKRGSQGRPFL